MTTPTPGGRARYQEIEGWLRARVLEGSPGDLLPSDSELAARFAVSRMTARQAMQRLAAEGLVERRRGAGTFIAHEVLHRHSGPLMSFTDDMRRRGMRARSRLLQAELRPATTDETRALGLPTDSRVVSIARLRFADDQPMAIERTALTADCAPVLADDIENGSLHDALRRLGRAPTSAKSWIASRLAEDAELSLLELSPPAPVLVERRLITDQAGLALERTTTVYDGARYVIDAEFTLSTDPS